MKHYIKDGKEVLIFSAPDKMIKIIKSSDELKSSLITPEYSLSIKESAGSKVVVLSNNDGIYHN